MVRIAVSIFIIALLSGCYNSKKATKQVAKAYVKQPQVTSLLCSKFYPPVVEYRDSMVVVPGESTIVTDTIEVECDSVGTKTVFRTRIVHKPDTIYKATTVTKVDRAMIDHLERERAELAQKNAKKQGYINILLIILGIILLKWIVTFIIKKFSI